MTSKRFPYVHTFADRHGRTRHYFRRGDIRVPLPETIGSREFHTAYKAALDGAPIPPRRKLKAEKIRQTIELAAKEPTIGVYILMAGGDVAYIGSSMNMPKRVETHRINGRPFDKAFFIKTTLGERAALERALIRALRPSQNRTGWGEMRTSIGKIHDPERQTGT